jgi:hypothetical protein
MTERGRRVNETPEALLGKRGGRSEGRKGEGGAEIGIDLLELDFVFEQL